MKRLIEILFIAVAFLCLSLDSNAQDIQSEVFDIYEEYAGKDGFTTVYITPKMFELFANIEIEDDEEAEEVVNIVRNLKGIRILVYDNEQEDDDGNTIALKNLHDPKKLYNDFSSLVPRDFYEDLLVIKDDETDVKFMVHESSPGTITELLMLVGDPENFVFISLAGIINLRDISKLSKSVEIDGLEHLGKLEGNTK